MGKRNAAVRKTWEETLKLCRLNCRNEERKAKGNRGKSTYFTVTAGLTSISNVKSMTQRDATANCKCHTKVKGNSRSVLREEK